MQVTQQTTNPNAEGDAGASTLDRLLVLLPVGQHRLVLAADQVREVVTVSDITPLPRVSSALLGAVAVRGALLPLYEVRTWCGDPIENSDLDGIVRFGTILEVEDASFALKTSDHPTIVMSQVSVTHRTPLVIGDDVCIGIDPAELLRELTSDDEPTIPTDPGATA